MGIPTLITTNTEAGDADSIFTMSGAYDEYLFVFTNVNPATDNVQFSFNVSKDDGSNYGIVKTGPYFIGTNNESDSGSLAYSTTYDTTDSTSAAILMHGQGNGADECLAGTLNFFTPYNTTYVKGYYSRITGYGSDNRANDVYTAGYVEDAATIDRIRFQFSSGNFDGVITQFGIK